MTCRQWVVSGVTLQAAALATVGRRQRPVLIIMPLCRVKSGRFVSPPPRPVSGRYQRDPDVRGTAPGLQARPDTVSRRVLLACVTRNAPRSLIARPPSRNGGTCSSVLPWTAI